MSAASRAVPAARHPAHRRLALLRRGRARPRRARGGAPRTAGRARTCCWSGSGVNFIDIAGCELLVQAARYLRDTGGTLYLCNLKPGVHEALERGGFLDEIGRDRVWPTKADAIRALYRRLDLPRVRSVHRAHLHRVPRRAAGRHAAAWYTQSPARRPECSSEISTPASCNSTSTRRTSHGAGLAVAHADRRRAARHVSPRLSPDPMFARRRRAREGSAGALAIRAGAAPRRAGAPLRQRAARAQGRARHARHARDRQASAGRPGRSAGDDRHLRLRRRAVAPAARTHHRLRAARPPDARDVASVRRVRRDLGVQLSRRGVGVERGAGARMRQRGHLEAVGEDAAVGVGGACSCCGARCEAFDPCARRRRAARDRRPRARHGARRASRRAPRQRHRLDRDGTRGRRGVRARLQAHHPRARRQQRGDRVPVRGSRPRAARDRVRGGRHRRPALHDAAPPVRAAQSLYAPFVAALAGRVRAASASAIRARTDTLVGPLIDRAAYDAMQRALAEAAAEGGKVAGGERVLADRYPQRVLRASGDGRNAGADRRRCCARPSRRSSTCCRSSTSTKRSR